ncbi:MAG: hypothetical protein WCV50_04135 [Patescibacteria group bacterium]|jgi:5-methyltetrahydropteroyltriglutamate--homocysteine methyltransferase
MIPLSIELNGTFPRSEALVSATRDFDRKRIGEDELRRILLKQQDSLVQFQEKLGVINFSDGLLNWQDLFRPFSVFCQGIKPVTLTRFADTNTFFRQPSVSAKLQYTGQGISDFFRSSADKKWKATLPAPFYFARVAEDKHYGSIKKLALAFTDVLADLIIDLTKKSYKSFQLIDPYLGYWGANRSEILLVKETIGRLIEKTKASIIYQTSFNCSVDALKMLAETDLDGIGIDFFNTDINAVPSLGGRKALSAGCLDSRTSLVEDPKTLAQFIEQAIKKIKPRELKATANLDLQYVPVPIAQSKLLKLQAAIKLVNNKQK